MGDAHKCSCIAGYVCSCDFSRKTPRYESINYVTERTIKKRRSASALMLKRLDADLVEPDLLARLNTQKP